eukprot:m.18460 g.18460  ORF g.18460 m.18460 type:complete len:70 (-) comp4963_c0_seq2:145-354(-)
MPIREGILTGAHCELHMLIVWEISMFAFEMVSEPRDDNALVSCGLFIDPPPKKIPPTYPSSPLQFIQMR